MIDTLYTALTATGSSTLSAVLTCFIMHHLLKRDEEQKRKTEQELLKIKEDQWQKLQSDVRNLGDRLNTHISGDQTGVIMNELKNISGNITKLLDQQQLLLTSDSEQRSQIVTLFKGLREQKEELKSCQKEHKG